MTATAERFNLPPIINTPPAMPAPDDLYLMLVAWNSGSEDQREAALDCAERNRIAARHFDHSNTTAIEGNRK